MAIVSWSKKFIFIKTHKTAGTSMEVDLAAHCDDDDIVTPIFPPNQNHVPRNYQVAIGTFYNHMPATEIEGFIGERHFANAFKFCFERHPVDKCLSHFGMLINSPHHNNPDAPSKWEEYLDYGEFPKDDNLYCDQEGKVIVDRIYRYDQLRESWKDICTRLNIPVRPIQAKEKTGFRAGVPTFGQVMANLKQKERIMEAFSASVQLLRWN